MWDLKMTSLKHNSYISLFIVKKLYWYMVCRYAYKVLLLPRSLNLRERQPRICKEDFCSAQLNLCYS